MSDHCNELITEIISHRRFLQQAGRYRMVLGLAYLVASPRLEKRSESEVV